MKLIYKGTYKGIVDEFDGRKELKNAVKYKEADSTDELMKIIMWPANILQLVLLVFVIVVVGKDFFEFSGFLKFLGAFVLSLVLLIPHELLHGICYKGRVYLYTNIKQLMLFVVGEDYMSKWKYIFMGLLPNIIFGFIPFILFLINTKWVFLGLLGVMCIPSGIGDYYNVYNTLRQVPKGAKVFMKGFNTYWYLPEEK
ncbi:MAG: DUF3267 domain-containing protein [Bacilli bacterium]|nr:DUF3267 domain-containing protein [Bacilli bacterium]